MGKKRRIIYVSRPWEPTGICSGCRLCELYCSLQKTGAFNTQRSRVRLVEMATGIDIPVTCQQCQDPACRAACPAEAIDYDRKLDIVTVNDEKCTGCGKCVGACPIGIITMDPVGRKAIKCDLCGGQEPACVVFCPSKVLAAADDLEAAEYNRRRFAAILAAEDDHLRASPAGENPVMRNPERRKKSS